MRAPFDEITDLVRTIGSDATFWRLLAAISVVALLLLLIDELPWVSVVGFIGLNCLAAMLEVLWRDR